jgi:beta-glucosidase/6-phospho-beta-glucosidase/beta-galactosidase
MYKIIRDEDNVEVGRADADRIHVVIQDDLRAYFKKNYTRSLGRAAAKGMREDGFDSWIVYPEDLGIPTYTIVRFKPE